MSNTRILRESARRAGASFLGTHFTGLSVDRDNLAELLQYRRQLDHLVLDSLRSVAGVHMAMILTETDPSFYGCKSASEIAQFNFTARRMLADALMILGRLEAFVWAISNNIGPAEIKTILNHDKSWRAVVKSTLGDTHKRRKAETAQAAEAQTILKAKAAQERPLTPPPIVDPVTGKQRRAHRVRSRDPETLKSSSRYASPTRNTRKRQQRRTADRFKENQESLSALNNPESES